MNNVAVLCCALRKTTSTAVEGCVAVVMVITTATGIQLEEHVPEVNL